jgi:hypothetical protein
VIRHSLKHSASSSLAVSQSRPNTVRKFNHSPNEWAYFFHVNGDIRPIRRVEKNSFTRRSGKPDGEIRKGWR